MMEIPSLYAYHFKLTIFGVKEYGPLEGKIGAKLGHK